MDQPGKKPATTFLGVANDNKPGTTYKVQMGCCYRAKGPCHGCDERAKLVKHVQENPQDWRERLTGEAYLLPHVTSREWNV